LNLDAIKRKSEKLKNQSGQPLGYKDEVGGENDMQMHGPWQLVTFGLIILLVGGLTFWRVRAAGANKQDTKKEYFLAGGGLSWFYVAGAITITNLGTEQLVGMNGNQMILLAWWELAAVAGLLMLTFVFLPIYYKYNCTTTTELLEKRYRDGRIRALISTIFMLALVFLSMPSALYTGALFMQTAFGVDVSIMLLAFGIAVLGAAYGLMGGLRAVAISETFSGTSLLIICLLIVFLGLSAINFSFDGIPAERLTMIGDKDSPIPWPTLFTGMLFIQMYYWSTNQAITQKAMASPSLKEAQKGVLAAAAIRVMIIPMIVVIPGIIAYKLYGDIGDASFGRLVGDVLPPWLSGIFAAVLVTSVATHFVAIMNAAASLYVCDIHQRYINPHVSIKKLSLTVSLVFIAIAIAMVPVYANAESIINLLQELNGLTSMPILAAFAVGLLFRNVDARAAIIAVIFGIAFYAMLSFVWKPFGLHYIHLMAFNLFATIGVALTVNLLVFGKKASLVHFWTKAGRDSLLQEDAEVMRAET
jgi:solute:Na+ symporter, SSS family